MADSKDDSLGAGKRRHRRTDSAYEGGAGNVDASAWMALIRKAPTIDPPRPGDPLKKPGV